MNRYKTFNRMKTMIIFMAGLFMMFGGKAGLFDDILLRILWE